MSDENDINGFSLDRISELAMEAGQEAREENLKHGGRVLSKDVDTGKFFFEELDADGEVVKHYLTPEELEAINRNG